MGPMRNPSVILRRPRTPQKTVGAFQRSANQDDLNVTIPQTSTMQQQGKDSKSAYCVRDASRDRGTKGALQPSADEVVTIVPNKGLGVVEMVAKTEARPFLKSGQGKSSLGTTQHTDSGSRAVTKERVPLKQQKPSASFLAQRKVSVEVLAKA